jgi:hypothetical protein
MRKHYLAQRAQSALHKKNREENKFSSRVEVGFMTPKAFRGRDQALGLNASFFFSLFSWRLSCVFLPSTIPPFQSAEAEGCEDFGMNSSSLTTTK